MNGYIKKIGVIRQLKEGFAADGGSLSGVARAETYAGFLKVEVSLLNFAPLTEGRYVIAVGDGQNTVIFDGCSFEGETPFDLSRGFALLVCVANGSVSAVASATSGQTAHILPSLRDAVAISERGTGGESAKNNSGGSADYDDEAIAEDNYYEFQADEDGGAVRPPEKEKEERDEARRDEANTRPVAGAKGEGAEVVQGGLNCEQNDKGAPIAENISGEACESVAEIGESGGEAERGENDGGVVGGLAGGDFYEKMQGEIERIFAEYPAEERLQRAMEGSRWVKIGYGDGKHYAFGVIYADGRAEYICYGVPSSDGRHPPESLADRAAYMPVDDGGYWIMYQDARTGIAVKISVS